MPVLCRFIIAITEDKGVHTATYTNLRFSITYSTGPIENSLAPGGSNAWAPGEIAKAHPTEVAAWNAAVSAVQGHEQGHVTVWQQVQASHGVEYVIASVSGTGSTAEAAMQALGVAVNNLLTAKTTAISTDDDAAQEAYHNQVGTTIDFNTFTIGLCP